MQEAALEEMKKELQARPTEKTVDDLRKKVKILQVVLLFLASTYLLFWLTFVTSLFLYLLVNYICRQWDIIQLKLKTGKWLQAGKR